MEQLTISGTEVRCLRCGHILTDQKSIREGYGRKCAKLITDAKSPFRRNLADLARAYDEAEEAGNVAAMADIERKMRDTLNFL